MGVLSQEEHLGSPDKGHSTTLDSRRGLRIPSWDSQTFQKWLDLSLDVFRAAAAVSERHYYYNGAQTYPLRTLCPVPIVQKRYSTPLGSAPTKLNCTQTKIK